MTLSLRTAREIRRESTLREAFTGANADKAMTLIMSYLERRLGTLHKMPGVEHFENSHGEGFGLRYFTANGHSFRFNWKSADGGDTKSITSIDVWNGSSHDPNAEIQVAGISLTKILPSLADLILRPEVGEVTVIAEGRNKSGSILTEARAGADPTEILDEMIELFVSGQPFSEHKLSQIGRTTALSLWRKIMRTHPEFFTVEQSGKRTFYTIANKKITKKKFNIDEILGSSVTLSVEMGASGERYTSAEMKRLEGEARAANAIPYEEQLSDLTKLVKAVARGASNALFVGGAGGTGKTYKVEEALGELGLSDGAGYFKNTTSASASGMYKTLYDYRDSIILFDDCDAVFKDQESRNLLKAATDTKHNRKIAWMKNAFWIYKGNPADLEKNADEMRDDFGEDPMDDEDRKYPRFFTFSGRIIFISNLQLDQLDPDGALRTRGFVISINPTTDEMLNFMEKIIDTIKLEDGLSLDGETRRKVLDVVKGGMNSDEMNMRKLVRGMNMAAADIPGWESLVSRYA